MQVYSIVSVAQSTAYNQAQTAESSTAGAHHQKQQQQTLESHQILGKQLSPEPPVGGYFVQTHDETHPQVYVRDNVPGERFIYFSNWYLMRSFPLC